MGKYDEIEFKTDNVEEFINDLDESDILDLVRIVAGLDRLAMQDGKAVFTPDQIAVIGKFLDFAEDKENVKDEDEDDEDDDVLDDEEIETDEAPSVAL